MIPKGEPNPELYQAVLDAPDDDEPRLAYADWFDANGQPERARFIRLQCWHARLAEFDPAHARLQMDADMRLLTHHRKAWLQGRLEFQGATWRFLRGFPELAHFRSPQAFAKFYGNLSRHHVRRIAFHELRSPDRLAAEKRLAGVRELDLFRCCLDDDSARRLLASPHLRQLTWLGLASNSVGPAGAAAIADLPHLLHLDLRGCWGPANNIGPDGAELLARAPWLPRLDRLLLSCCGVGDEGLIALAESAPDSRLTVLDLGPNGITAEGLAAVLRRRAWPRLRAVSLMGNRLGNAGAELLASASHWRELEVLDLIDCGIGDAGVAALAGSPLLARVRTLVLGCNAVGDAGARALAGSPHLRAVRELYLSRNLIGKRGGLALGRSANLPDLRTLAITHNGMTEELATALTERFARQDVAPLAAFEEPALVVEIPAPPLPDVGGTRDDRALMEAIADDPDDELPMRAYADWLEDNDDPEWAELIRLRLHPDGDRHEPQRQAQLRDAVLGRRLAPFRNHLMCGNAWGGLLAVHVALRSFLTKAFQAHAAGWFDEARVQGMYLWGRPKDWRRVFASPVLARVRHLSLSYNGFNRAALQALFASPHLGAVHTLELAEDGVNYEVLDDLVRDHPACLPRLRRLHLDENRVGEHALATLLTWPQVGRLTTLSLADTRLTGVAAARLGACERVAGLRRLDLSRNNLGDPGAIALASSLHLAGLTHLHLHGCGIEADGALALAASPHLGHLVSLDLGDNAIGDEAALALARSAALANLRQLCLSWEGLSDGCRRELEQRHGGRVRPWVFR